MAELADNAILKWAVDVIAAAPPMQNVVAFLIILLLAAPLIRAGWREFKSKEKVEPPLPPMPPPALIQETPWLIQTLTRIQLEIEQLTRDVATLNAAVAVVDKIMRRRAAKQRK